MFERFTEDARRALFFARAKTSERDGSDITPEDLLWGITMVAPALVGSIGPSASEAALNPIAWFHALSAQGLQRPTSVNVPFTNTMQRVFEWTVQEADALGSHDLRPEHLLLGLLRAEGTEAWRTLNEAGVMLASLRRSLGAQE